MADEITVHFKGAAVVALATAIAAYVGVILQQRFGTMSAFEQLQRFLLVFGVLAVAPVIPARVSGLCR